MNPVFVKAYRAAENIAPYRIVKLTSDGLKQAVSLTDRLAGMSAGIPSAIGQHADVIRVGIANLQLGGSVSIGDEITSDAEGKGIALTGTGESVGRADEDGVAGDIITVFLTPSTKVGITD
jgi:hypothetical protein